MLTEMTLYSRNVFFRVEITISALFIILTGILAFKALPVFPATMEESVRRSPGIVQNFIAHFLAPSPYVPFVSLAGGGIYSLVTLVLIYFSFEKTQAPEILFITLFVLSFSFETMRFLIPLQKIWAIPSVYLLLASRVLLFGRFFGIFALFTAGVYAAGLEVQKQINALLIIAFISLVVSLGIPIDILTWDSSFSMINGYLSLFRMTETVVFVITMMSFFISAWSRGTPEYVTIGFGSFLAYAGRSILLSGDTWISPLPGLLLLVAGAWLICTKLHKVYLWL
ncbi:MAG: hypothetical protein LBF95_05585 [Treponema sp.]|jgi:hypothetical protein|nr:hypothetical protein [Treponema sp.]